MAPARALREKPKESNATERASAKQDRANRDKQAQGLVHRIRPNNRHHRAFDVVEHSARQSRLTFGGPGQDWNAGYRETLRAGLDQSLQGIGITGDDVHPE